VQLKLLKDMPPPNGFAVVRECVDVETAKQTGRAMSAKPVRNERL
jgi:hypothetical protein